MAAGCCPTVRCQPFHWRLIYSLEGYLSVYTVLGPGVRAIKMDLPVQRSGWPESLAPHSHRMKEAVLGRRMSPHHTRGNRFKETKTLGPTASEFRSQLYSVDTHTDCVLLPPPQGNRPQAGLLWGPRSDPTGQALGLGLIPTAPAPSSPSAAHPTNQLSFLLTFRPILKLSASSKAPKGV